MFPLRPSKVKIPGNRVRHKEAHTSPTRFGMGDNYGTGLKNPLGKLREDTQGYKPVSKRQMGTPPKSLA